MKRNDILEKYLSKRSLIIKRFAVTLISIILICTFFILNSKGKDFIATISIEGIINDPVETLNELEKINKSFNNLKIKNPRLESFLTASTKGLINNKSNYDKFIKSATGLE